MSRRRSRRLRGDAADRSAALRSSPESTPALARMCLDKSRLADEPAARAMAMHMIGAGWIKRSKAWVYRCSHCRGWHITTHGGGANYLAAAVTLTDPYVLPELRP